MLLSTKPIALNLFPGGKKKTLTLSYDDGTIHDRRFVELLNTNGIRGTFHLNSGNLDKKNKVGKKEVAQLYAGHEVSVHGVTHPDLPLLPIPLVYKEIMDDRKQLEDLVGYPIRGMSYPFGNYTMEIVRVLPAIGIEYSRVVETHNKFMLPQNPLLWEATCHHRGELLKTAKTFLTAKPARNPVLFNVWGHTHEFERDGNWNLAEEFCRMVGRSEEVWYATYIEIVDYMNAMRALRFSAEGTVVYNPSAIDVWFSADGQPVAVKAGETIALGSEN